MNLLPEWKHLMCRAWSIRLALVAAVFSGIEVVLPMFSDVIPQRLFAGLAFTVAIGATLSRVVAQPKMHE